MKNEIQTKQRAPFVMVDSKLLLSEKISLYEKIAYCVLCAYANNNDRSCFPSYETISRKAGCSRSKVINVIASLEARGLVEKQKRLNKNGENRSNIYVVKPLIESGINPDRVYAEPPGVHEIPPVNLYEKPPGTKRKPPGAERTPELNFKKYTPDNYTYPSVYREIKPMTDRLTELKSRIEYGYFEANFPDKILTIDSLLTYISELYNECPSHDIRFLNSIDSLKVMGFLDYAAEKCYARVRNFKAYYKKMLMEYLKEDELLASTAGRFWQV